MSDNLYKGRTYEKIAEMVKESRLSQSDQELFLRNVMKIIEAKQTGINLEQIDLWRRENDNLIFKSAFI